MKESLVGSLRANGHSLLNCLRVWKWVGELIVIRVSSGKVNLTNLPATTGKKNIR